MMFLVAPVATVYYSSFKTHCCFGQWSFHCLVDRPAKFAIDATAQVLRWVVAMTVFRRLLLMC